MQSKAPDNPAWALLLHPDFCFAPASACSSCAASTTAHALSGLSLSLGALNTLAPHVLLQARSVGTLAARHAHATTMLALHAMPLVCAIQALWQRVPANGCGSSKPARSCLTVRSSRRRFTATNFSGMFVLYCGRAAARLNSGVRRAWTKIMSE